MNAQAQTVLDHFGMLSGLGGFAVHNYQNSYLSGSSAAWPQTDVAFPAVSHEVKITALSRAANGRLRIQGSGVSNRTYHVEVSPNLAPNSFMAIDSTTTNATGAIDYSDATAAGQMHRFYRFSFP